MKILHFDCFAGISGDMALGALVDLGVDPEALLRELNKFGIPGWRLTFRRDERGGISGLHADVQLEGRTDHIAHSEAAPDEAHAHSHDGTGPHCHGEAHAHRHDGIRPHCHDEAHAHRHDGTEPHCHDEAHLHRHDGTGPHHHDE
ncbi:MAG: LarC family nickel insertion protein, partial [Treponema sp.]|nr:LarC family nickel insertion protein [Treponema sp.]